MSAHYELITPCHFGLESVMKREITDLGYDVTEVCDGKVTFAGDAEAIARANIFLRTTERVLLKAGEFKATTYDELFEATKAIPWETIFQRTANSGWPRQTQLNQSFFHRRIFSPL